MYQPETLQKICFLILLKQFTKTQLSGGMNETFSIISSGSGTFGEW